jgi:hypothetical protein
VIGAREVIELDGPPMAYFEIPLDYWATPNGEIEPEGHPEATRLIQRVVYLNFRVVDHIAVKTVVDRVTARLQELGGGYIWWRSRPALKRVGSMPFMAFRLGTTPQLPQDWWYRLSDDVHNDSASGEFFQAWGT